MRTIPDINLKEIKDYATILAKGWDTIKETFNIVFPESLFDQLNQCRIDGHDQFRMEEGLMIQFGGETFKLSPYGTRNALYVLKNDDFMILLRSPKMGWAVSVEYSSAGLWEHGFEALRNRAIGCLLKEGRAKPYKDSKYTDISDDKAWQRISQAHFAFDFYSPEFTKDMNPSIIGRIVCPSSTKKCENFTIEGSAWGKGTNIQTITIGKKNSLQVQIYDKGREITDVSGKTWMFTLWEREGYHPPEDKKAKDVWRLEIRFGSDFLKDRGILTARELHESLSALLTEAIFMRRLTVESVTDKNRWRWALHPLYVAAYREIGDDMILLPIGRQQTESDKAKAERIKKNIAGNIRSLTILSIGDMDEMAAIRLTNDAYNVMIHDPDGDKKTEKAINRYYFTKEAA